MENQNDKPTSKQSIWTWLIPFIILVFFIGFLPYLITTRSWFNIDFSTTGQVGDTIGGIMGPFIAIIAAFLTFGAFWVQYQANQNQREQFQTQLNEQKAESLKQEQLVRIERFETRFFELIKLHKENINEITIKDTIKGRKAFVYLFEEFRYSYCVLKNFIESEALSEWFPNDAGFNKDDEETITNLSYLTFFIGVGENSDPLLYSYTRNICSKFFMEKVVALYKSEQQKYLGQKSLTSMIKSRMPDLAPDKKKNYPKMKVPNKEIKELVYTARYKPFSGHISKLGHYYRHLFQTVKFVDQVGFLKEDDKKKYVKSLRAQLSSHEQLLLYYNTISKFGQPWNQQTNNYIVKYKMIKNIPLPLAGFGLTPEKKYKTDIDAYKLRGEELFEWFE